MAGLWFGLEFGHAQPKRSVQRRALHAVVDPYEPWVGDAPEIRDTISQLVLMEVHLEAIRSWDGAKYQRDAYKDEVVALELFLEAEGLVEQLPKDYDLHAAAEAVSVDCRHARARLSR